MGMNELWYADLNRAVKINWATLRKTTMTQFEVEADVEADKYLLQ